GYGLTVKNFNFFFVILPRVRRALGMEALFELFVNPQGLQKRVPTARADGNAIIKKHNFIYMKFFIDTANLNEIKAAQALGVLDGVTTNPSLMAKEGISGKN